LSGGGSWTDTTGVGPDQIAGPAWALGKGKCETQKTETGTTKKGPGEGNCTRKRWEDVGGRSPGAKRGNIQQKNGRRKKGITYGGDRNRENTLGVDHKGMRFWLLKKCVQWGKGALEFSKHREKGFDPYTGFWGVWGVGGAQGCTGGGGRSCRKVKSEQGEPFLRCKQPSTSLPGGQTKRDFSALASAQSRGTWGNYLRNHK